VDPAGWRGKRLTNVAEEVPAGSRRLPGYAGECPVAYLGGLDGVQGDRRVGIATRFLPPKQKGLGASAPRPTRPLPSMGCEILST
jgi:hypothetical protein